MRGMNTPPRPNIILLTTDQQRGDCIGIDENAPACLQTPHLDAMAKRGVRFRRGYTECPSCVPARRSLMTGMAPAAQGMVGMTGSPWNPPHTLAGELHNAGYHTYLVGKLHLQPTGKRFGFNHQVLSDAPMDAHDEYARFLRDVHGYREHNAAMAHGQDPNGWDARPTHLREDQTHSYWCVSQAIDFLEHKRDPTSPFFLNVSLFDPHPPINPPQWQYERYIHRDLPMPALGDWAAGNDPGFEKGHDTSSSRIKLTDQQMRCTRAGYYATINHVDDQVGRLVRYLIRNRLMDNTWILFTSDHGEMLGDHYLYRKCFAYEGSARVPFFILPPAKAADISSQVSDQPVGLQDVMPTLLDIAGAPIPPACTGQSLLPLIQGRQSSVRDVLHGEHAGQYQYNDGVQYLVGRQYKYIWYTQTGREHLFDLHADPLECHDLVDAPAQAGRLTDMRSKLIAILQDRPEGFVREGQLVTGAPHKHLIPEYEDGRFYPYL